MYGVYTSTGFKDQSLRCTFHSVKDSVYVHTCTHKLNKTNVVLFMLVCVLLLLHVGTLVTDGTLRILATERTLGMVGTVGIEGTLGTVM